MRSAIVHDWFQGFHGAERTVAAMLDLFARDPDIFTFHAARELLPERLRRAIVRESRLARLPGVRQRGHDPGRWRWLLPYMPRYFERLDLSGYELVVSSSHACAAGVHTAPETLHVCYCHTPMRYVWMADGRARPGPRRQGRRAARRFRGRLRRWDRRASQRPDVYVANSTAVAERIERFYGREAHGGAAAGGDRRTSRATSSATRPISSGCTGWSPTSARSRWPRRFASFADLRLTMVGRRPARGPAARGHARRTSSCSGGPTRDELARLFASAGGFIHVGEEDFGISMVEALAAGTPVLAADRGGARDIVRPGQDGVLISDPSDPDAIRAGVRELAARDVGRRRAARRARERFSEERFRERFGEVLRSYGAR